jgi:hypothetical protein
MDIKISKNIKMRFLLIGLISLFTGISESNAQMRFPNGSTLNLNTNNSVLYLETRILFNTGIYKSSDYRWEKISDSIDSRWFVTSCFNGDCKNELLQSGQFIRDFGVNDTTCFLAFHVDCNEHNGNSLIKYNVFNSKNMNDYATLTFNINYTNMSSVESIDSYQNFKIFPNPANENLTIYNNNKETFDIELLDSQGLIVDCINSHSYLLHIPLSKNKYSKGIYFVRITSNEKSQFYKLVIE